MARVIQDRLVLVGRSLRNVRESLRRGQHPAKISAIDISDIFFAALRLMSQGQRFKGILKLG